MLGKIINWIRNGGHSLPARCPTCNDLPRDKPVLIADCPDEWHIEKLWERHGILGQARRAEKRL